jgi:hypothetical protein
MLWLERIFAFLFFLFYTICIVAAPSAYLLEILKFTQRAKGLTIFNVSQVASYIFRSFTDPVALETIR